MIDLFYDGHEALRGKTKGIISELYSCPECEKEDRERYGASYLHRIHQIPGITKCPHHGCSLVNVKTGEEKQKIEVDERIEDKYNAFCIDLLSNWIPRSVTDIGIAVKSRMEELWLTSEELEKQLTENGYQNLVPFTYKQLKQILKFGNLANISTIIGLCVFLFDNVKSLISYLPIEDDETSFHQELAEYGYTLVSEYNGVLIQLQHNACGHTFYTSPHAFPAGWQCPVCDGNLTDAEFFQRLVSLVDNFEYVLRTPYIDNSHTVSIIHKTCGREFALLPGRFLSAQGKCNCTRLTFFKAKNTVEKNGQFELLSFDEETQDLRVKSISCGHEYDIGYWNHRKHPDTCRECFRLGRIKAREAFMRSINEKSGGLYEVLYMDGVFCTIRNTEDNTEITLRRRVLLNELESPKQVIMERERLWEHMQNTYTAADIIFSKDISYISSNSTFAVSNALAWFVRQGKLIRLDEGIFAYPNTAHTIYDVLSRKHHLGTDGYYFGKTFLWQMGVIKDEPETICIAINSVKYQSTRKIMKRTYYVKPALTAITEDNKHLLPLLDALRGLKQYYPEATDDVYHAFAGYCKHHEITTYDLKNETLLGNNKTFLVRKEKLILLMGG